MNDKKYFSDSVFYAHLIYSRILRCINMDMSVLSNEQMPIKPGGALGVMVILAGNGHGDTSSNHIALIPLGKV